MSMRGQLKLFLAEAFCLQGIPLPFSEIKIRSEHPYHFVLQAGRACECPGMETQSTLRISLNKGVFSEGLWFWKLKVQFS